MNLLREAHRHLISAPFDWQNIEQEVAKEVNAMNNYEFLELLDAIFDEAVREVSR